MPGLPLRGIIPRARQRSRTLGCLWPETRLAATRLPRWRKRAAKFWPRGKVWPRTSAAQTGRRLWRDALLFSGGGRPAELSGDFLEAPFQRLAGIGKHLRTGCAQLLFRRCRDPRNHIARLVIELGDGRQNPGIGNVLQPAFVLTGGIVAYVLQVRAHFILLLLAERFPRFQQRRKSGRNRFLRFANPAFERTGHSRLEPPQEVFLL